MPGPRRSVPNGSTQRFTWLTQWLHLSQRLLSTFFKETTSVLLPSDCLFLGGSISPQEGQSRTLQRLKTSFQAKASWKYWGRHPTPTTPPKDRNRKFQGDFDNVGDFDWTEFWCLGLFRTSLQLQRARCHCSGYTGPRSPNACAPKTTRKIMKKHQNPQTQHETTLLEGIVERC